MKQQIKGITIVVSITVLLLAFCRPQSNTHAMTVEQYSYVNDYVSIYIGGDEDQMVVGGLTPYGGGGSIVCCYSIPIKWRADYKIPVKWVVPGKEENTWEEHTVDVPIAEYDEKAIGNLQVHVLPDYSIKLIVSKYDRSNPNHPLHPLYLSQEGERAEYDKQAAIEYQKWYESLPDSNNEEEEK